MTKRNASPATLTPEQLKVMAASMGLTVVTDTASALPVSVAVARDNRRTVPFDMPRYVAVGTFATVPNTAKVGDVVTVTSKSGRKVQRTIARIIPDIIGHLTDDAKVQTFYTGCNVALLTVEDAVKVKPLTKEQMAARIAELESQLAR